MFSQNQAFTFLNTQRCFKNCTAENKIDFVYPNYTAKHPLFSVFLHYQNFPKLCKVQMVKEINQGFKTFYSKSQGVDECFLIEKICFQNMM